MTKETLYLRLKEEVRKETEATTEILRLINIAHEKRFYLEFGFSSLFDWLTGEFKYSAAAAQRRIESARLLRAVPEIKEKMEAGEVNLTTLAKAQSMIRAQEKATGKRVSQEFKEKIVQTIENKSTIEAEKSLFTLMPECRAFVNQERRIVLDENTTRHSMNFTKEMSKNLQRLKEVLSHKFPNATDADIVGFALAKLLESTDPLLKRNNRKLKNKSVTSAAEVGGHENASDVVNASETQPQSKRKTQTTKPASSFKSTQGSNPAPLSKSAVRRITVQTANAACTYKDPLTGKICGSRYQTQIDHIHPKALGGADTPDNLRVLCRQHNLLMAELYFGKNHMRRFRHLN